MLFIIILRQIYVSDFVEGGVSFQVEVCFRDVVIDGIWDYYYGDIERIKFFFGFCYFQGVVVCLKYFYRYMQICMR